MFDDLEDAHLGTWAFIGVTCLLLAGLMGGLWIKEWQLSRSQGLTPVALATAANPPAAPPQRPPAP